MGSKITIWRFKLGTCCLENHRDTVIAKKCKIVAAFKLQLCLIIRNARHWFMVSQTRDGFLLKCPKIIDTIVD